MSRDVSRARRSVVHGTHDVADRRAIRILGLVQALVLAALLIPTVAILL